jgi:hypothetical protein
MSAIYWVIGYYCAAVLTAGYYWRLTRGNSYWKTIAVGLFWWVWWPLTQGLVGAITAASGVLREANNHLAEPLISAWG